MFPTSAVFRAGLAAFTKIFADTYAADNIRMNNVLPGWIDSLPQTEERRDSVPMKRYGKVEEIAATVVVPGLRRRRLHHRPEHPRRRRADALGLRRAHSSRVLAALAWRDTALHRASPTKDGAWPLGHTRHPSVRTRAHTTSQSMRTSRQPKTLRGVPPIPTRAGNT